MLESEADGSAMHVTHLYHSGFLIELGGSKLLFDWFPETQERANADLALLDGAEKLYVFSSHAHHDHYAPAIWDLQRYRGLADTEITYIVDDEVAALAPAGNGLDIVACEPEMVYEIDDDMEVTTLESTDEGIAFCVDVLGKTVYHAGDLSIWWWPERDESLNVLSEQHFLYFLQILEGRHIDLAMLPITPRAGADGDRGIAAFMERVGADVVVPMHYRDDRAGAMALAASERLAPWREKIRLDEEFEL